MSKFTEAPWKVETNKEHPTLHTIWNDYDVLIARTCFAPASEANAKLIAAAPMLYEALEMAISHLSFESNEITRSEFKFLEDTLKSATND